MELVNQTPFSVERLLLADQAGYETLTIVVKATFEQGERGLIVAKEQMAVQLSDEYAGEPGASSLTCAAEGVLFKPACDVVMLGHAHAPAGSTEIDVGLSVGPIQKTVRVLGDRIWRRPLGLLAKGRPEPFTKMPLVWERAFGGRDESGKKGPLEEPSNPVGVGFRSKRSKQKKAGTKLPNLEWARRTNRGDANRPPACGFGYVAPNWEPRRLHAGTYDDAWLADRAPLLPPDFDSRVHQVAPTDQIVEGYLQGGERVSVRNATSSGAWDFSVPQASVRATVMVAGEKREPDMQLDTMVIRCDEQQVSCIWRGSLCVQDEVYDVQWVKVSSEVSA